MLTPRSLDFADEIFDYFARAGFETLGFNVEETEGSHASALDERQRDRYRSFMTRLLERWRAAERRPKIRELESTSAAIAAFARDRRYTRAVDDLVPFRNLAVSRAGEISTFSPELASGTPSDPLRFSIGNVHRVRSLDQLAACPRFVEMRTEIERGIARCRAECGYFPLCGGGTASNKFYEKGTFDCAETASCALHRKTLADVVGAEVNASAATTQQPPES